MRGGATTGPTERTALRKAQADPSEDRLGLCATWFWLLPAILTATILAVGVSTLGAARIRYHWQLTVAAVFASLFAGSTPEGGSSVFFPTLTVVLGSSATTARTFGLCIQAIGMSVASLRILVTRMRVEWTVVAITLPPAALVEVLVLFRRDTSDLRTAAFWTPIVPGPVIQVTFLLVLTSMAFLSFILLRTADSCSTMRPLVEPWNASRVITLVVAAAVGGFLTALSATGAHPAAPNQRLSSPRRDCRPRGNPRARASPLAERAAAAAFATGANLITLPF